MGGKANFPFSGKGATSNAAGPHFFSSGKGKDHFQPPTSSAGYSKGKGAASQQDWQTLGDFPPGQRQPAAFGYGAASMSHRKGDASRGHGNGGEWSGDVDDAIDLSALGPDATAEEMEHRCKVYISGIPHGTGDGIIRLECKKSGDIISLVSNTAPGGLFERGWALIEYESADRAKLAVDKLSRRIGLFGAEKGDLEARLATHEDCEQGAAAHAASLQPAQKEQDYSSPLPGSKPAAPPRDAPAQPREKKR
jgi:hypothetical protein